MIFTLLLTLLFVHMPLAAMDQKLSAPQASNPLNERAIHLITEPFSLEYLQQLRNNDDQERTQLNTVWVKNEVKAYLIHTAMEQPMCQEELIPKYHKSLQDHLDLISSVAWSPDGKSLASASADMTICIWNPADGSHSRLIGHKGWVRSVTWSPDGRYLVSASVDETVRTWNPQNTRTNLIEKQDERATSVAWSPDGNFLASACYDGTVRISRNCEDQRIQLLQIPAEDKNGIWSVAWSPDSKSLACASEDTTIHIWHADTNTTRALTGHTKGVNSVTWSPDGKHLASASDDGTIRIWKLADGSCIKTLTGHSGKILSVAWSHNNMYLASGSTDKTVRLWHVAKGSCLDIFTGHTDYVHSVAWSPRENLLASGSWDKTVRIWQLNVQEKAYHALDALSLEQFVIVLSAYNAKKNNTPIILRQEEQTAFDAITSSEIKELVLGGIINDQTLEQLQRTTIS